ncbi:hypothetical protein G9464_15440 [Halostella sp. JP-L12]|uniref:hypothetical protein n=1 Tax=Halostella TaxID=1843185 RepID=UPI000EF7BCD2|nr:MULTISPECIES: hypothetical protein [Halostella]NHN48976.1 hypothetical protein [Halostella sp. JP-L12]
MDRTKRYALGVFVAAVVTGALYLAASPDAWSALLLVGVAQTYAVATAVALRHPDAWGASGNLWSGLFAGVTTFGAFVLLNGVEPTPNLTVAALGFGLAGVGFTAGVAFERERD